MSRDREVVAVIAALTAAVAVASTVAVFAPNNVLRAAVTAAFGRSFITHFRPN